MTHQHPKRPEPLPPEPYPDERAWRESATRRLEEQRRESGGLPDSPADNPVRERKPFRNLRGD